MPTKTQINKNLDLSNKLMEYLTSSTFKTKVLENVSYIVISKSDNKLNQANLDLAKSIQKKGKKVVKAIETGNKSTPWKFASL